MMTERLISENACASTSENDRFVCFLSRLDKSNRWTSYNLQALICSTSSCHEITKLIERNIIDIKKLKKKLS